MKKIAWLGTGLMGQPMAHRLLSHGFELVVWNRSEAKTRELALAGALVASSPQLAVQGVDTVVTMLSDGPVVYDLLFRQGVARALRPGTLLVDMSSIAPASAQAHARNLQELGVQSLDAPVSGGVMGAKAGSLAIMVGGDRVDFIKAQPLWDALGRATYVGPHGSGALAKVANQMIVGITIGAVAEALLLVQAGGGDPAALLTALQGGFADSRILAVHGKRMVERIFEPGAYCSTQLKDLDMACVLGQELGVALPLTRTVQGLYHEWVKTGGARLDHSALYLALEQLGITKLSD